MPPPRSATKPMLFHGWKIAVAGLVFQMLHSGLVFNSFTLFAAKLKDEFGWSNAVLGGAFSLNRAESGLLGPLQGWMTDSWGPRTVIRIGAVVMGVGFLAFSFTRGIGTFYASYLLIALGSSLAGFLTISVAVVHWFERKRARALAVTSMGFALGGFLAFGVGVLLDEFGWRVTARIAAVVSIAVIIPLTGWFHRRPADLGLLPDGEVPPAEGGQSSTTPAARHFTASEAMRTRAFWFLALGHASALLVVGAAMAHLATFLEDETPLGGVHRAVVVGSLPLMMGLGQLVGGVLGDLFDKRMLVTIAMWGHGSGLAALAAAHGAALVWTFVVLHGLAWGLRAPLQQAIRADYFGATDFGKIMGFSSLVIMTGMVIGPTLAGVIADVTGSFRVGFSVLAAAAAAGSLWFWFATPPTLPPKAASATT